jgi:4a-hydroxytetrahydrobiopterin dehydratase
VTAAWEEEAGALRKEFTFGDFAEALAFVNRVGAVAEQVGHHPDIDLRWSTVTLRLSTHSAGSVVTDRDHDLAKRIDEVVG